MVQAVQRDLGIGEENPFRKQEGDCGKCGIGRGQAPLGGASPLVRIFWCHACGRKFCRECFKNHPD